MIKMKKGINALIGLCVVILFILIIILISNFTGRVVEEQEKQVKFYFYDKSTNCVLNGYVFIGDKAIGKSVNGIFNLTYENYLVNFQNNEKISIFGELGGCFNNPELYFDKYWVVPEIKKYHFPGENIFNFEAEINSNNPSNRELQGFIQPEKTKLELGRISTNENNLGDLSKINNYLNNKINYVEDWDFDKKVNYWQTPVETLNLKQGDCEDYSTTLLSLFLSYDDSLNCHNIVFSSHVATFCYIEKYYIYYDQKRTERKKRINEIGLTKIKAQITELNQDYFEYVGVNDDNEKKAYYAFNDNEFVKFEDDEDFINWQYDISNKKQKSDLFLNIEEEIKINTQNLTESWEQAELQTQTISLPNQKISVFLILGLFLLIIILVVILIKFNKT